MKKMIKLFTMILVIVVSVSIMPFSDILAVSIGKVTDSTTLDAAYGFTPRFIPGVTQAVPFGMTNYAEDHWANDEDVLDMSERQSVRITSNAQKGNVGVRYNNVGTYQGQIVDLKLTLEDFAAFRPSGTYKGRPTYPTILFWTTSIRAQPQSNAFKGLKWGFQFYIHGTNTPLKVKLHNTFQDMDNKEYMVLNDGQGIDQVYLSRDSYLQVSGNKVYCPDSQLSSNGDKQHWTTILGESSYFSFTYGRSQDDEKDFSTKLGSRSFYWWVFTGEAVAKFSTPPISEQIDGTSQITVHADDEFNYEINTTIPKESSGSYYSFFKVQDTVADCFDINTASIAVLDDAGSNVTALFNISVSGQTVTFDIKNAADASFYGKSYKFVVPCKKIKGYDVSEWGNRIPNNSSISTDRGTINSNTVYTSITHNIISSAVNGTITESQYGIGATENRTFTYSSADADKYILENLIIDGKEASTAEYPSSYTFSNINDDHTIEARYKRVYSIATSAEGGNITETQKMIDAGESRTISYQPDEGYYLRRLTVDGKEVDLKKYPKSYTFSDINEDHVIHAEFLPKPVLTIKKDIRKEDIYYAHGTPTFLFRISGTDYMGDKQTYYAYIQFSKDDISNGRYVTDGGCIQKSVSLKDINAGQYEVSEINVSRYSLTKIKDVQNGVASDDKASVNMDGHDASVTFINDRTRYDLYTHNDMKINHFNK